MATKIGSPEVDGGRPARQAPQKRVPRMARALLDGWREFRSMRTALALLFLIAGASVLGSLFPQLPASPARVDLYASDHPAIAPLMRRLGLFDVFGSAWFMAIYIALLTALVGCIVPRIATVARVLRSRPPRGGRLERYRSSTVLEVPGDDPGRAAETAARVLARRRYRVAFHAGGEVAAEKGYLREVGSVVFHLSFLLLLVGLAFGKGLGFRGQMSLVQGDTLSNARVNYDSFRAGRFVSNGGLPPFALTLDRFANDFHPNGTPSEYASYLTATDAAGRVLERQKVTVNRPLTVDGVRIFQSDYGYAPMVRVTDPTGRVIQDGPVLLLRDPRTEISNGAVKLPSLEPQVGLVLTFFTDLRSIPAEDRFFNGPRMTNPFLIAMPYIGNLRSETAGSVFALDTTGLRPGLNAPLVMQPHTTKKLPDGSTVTFEGVRQYSVLTLARDPGVPVVGIAAALLLLGLLPSLYVTRRRVWLSAEPAGHGLRVRMAGLALQGKPAFADEFGVLVGEVASALGGDSPTGADTVRLDAASALVGGAVSAEPPNGQVPREAAGEPAGAHRSPGS